MAALALAHTRNLGKEGSIARRVHGVSSDGSLWASMMVDRVSVLCRDEDQQLVEDLSQAAQRTRKRAVDTLHKIQSKVCDAWRASGPVADTDG
jgi:hypothetical protein